MQWLRSVTLVISHHPDSLKETLKSCIWSIALYGSEIWTLGKNYERVVNAFETWCWRRMLKIK